ncbi:MAG TPA: hypothetical protein VGV15_01850 [Terriglobales bacterium]|nr:hypothetical protein [Terriglobales bacterium]
MPPVAYSLRGQRPRDPVQLTNHVFDIATGEAEDTVSETKARVAIHAVYYNFARIHKTLRIRLSMAAGLLDHVWSLKEIVLLAQ